LGLDFLFYLWKYKFVCYTSTSFLTWKRIYVENETRVPKLCRRCGVCLFYIVISICFKKLLFFQIWPFWVNYARCAQRECFWWGEIWSFIIISNVSPLHIWSIYYVCRQKDPFSRENAACFCCVWKLARCARANFTKCNITNQFRTSAPLVLCITLIRSLDLI
jgi:hypothetical protein